jgi:hypothetical protein
MELVHIDIFYNNLYFTEGNVYKSQLPSILEEIAVTQKVDKDSLKMFVYKIDEVKDFFIKLSSENGYGYIEKGKRFVKNSKGDIILNIKSITH